MEQREIFDFHRITENDQIKHPQILNEDWRMLSENIS